MTTRSAAIAFVLTVLGIGLVANDCFGQLFSRYRTRCCQPTACLPCHSRTVTCCQSRFQHCHPCCQRCCHPVCQPCRPVNYCPPVSPCARVQTCCPIAPVSSCPNNVFPSITPGGQVPTPTPIPFGQTPTENACKACCASVSNYDFGQCVQECLRGEGPCGLGGTSP